MMDSRQKYNHCRRGSVLALVVVMLLIVSLIGTGLLTVSYGVRVRAARLKGEALAMLAAEGAYEKAVFWMSQQGDILGALNTSGASGTIAIGESTGSYQVEFDSWTGSRPIFRVRTTGQSGGARRSVDVLMIQDIGGWAMAKCQVPSTSGTLGPVYFVDGEVIDMKIHINKQNDSPDVRDIWISGSPNFLSEVGMGESRYTSGGSDKYNDVIGLFNGGILFNQPAFKITDETAVQSKLDRFRASTKAAYTFTPTATANISGFTGGINMRTHPAVQIEMYKDAGTGLGMLRITNNCTVLGCKRTGNGNTYDYKLVPGSAGANYTQYDTYAYHYRKNTTAQIVQPVTDTYVTQTFGGHVSEPGGQIFVYGDVILGSDAYQMVLQGKLTIVAQRTGANTDDGHIWIADSIKVDGAHYPDTDPCHPGMPMPTNPNILGLIAQGVVKVIDPGISCRSSDTNDEYPGPPPQSGPPNVAPGATPPYTLNDTVTPAIKHTYVPVADAATGATRIYQRMLPDPVIIEAAITVGGGGFGAENVVVFDNHGNPYLGGRREYGETASPGSESTTDDLYVRGSIAEVVRGIVGVSAGGGQKDGFVKHYYMDERLLNGILPGDIWFGGKYLPAPAGWKDYRPTN